MTQHPTKPRQTETPTALVCPACELCAKPTRFVGLETLPNNNDNDLCTYECTVCGHVQASVIPHAGAHDMMIHH